MSEIYYSDVYKQYIKSNNDYIFKTSILQNIIWEEEICNLICQYIEPNTDFIDIGSNIGLISLAVNLLLCNQNIHCFECNPDTFMSLKYNTQDKPNIYLYNFGLSNKVQICNMNNNELNMFLKNVAPITEHNFNRLFFNGPAIYKKL